MYIYIYIYQIYMRSFRYMCIHIYCKYVNSNVLWSRNPFSRLLSCCAAPTGIWNLGHMQREDQIVGDWGCPDLCCKAVLAILVDGIHHLGWEMPNLKAMEIWQFVHDYEKFASIFCHISQWQDSYLKNHTAKPWYFSYAMTTAQVLVILV